MLPKIREPMFLDMSKDLQTIVMTRIFHDLSILSDCENGTLQL